VVGFIHQFWVNTHFCLLDHPCNAFELLLII
jgi:hypothetical protein